MLVVVDMQPTFMVPIHDLARVTARVRFLVEAAKVLGVPTFATEQYPERMGGTESSIAALLDVSPMPKTAFSCMGCEGLPAMLKEEDRKQVVLCGIETHICVNQTAHHLVDGSFEVLLAADAVSARTQDMHEIGVQRMRDAGAVIAHSESIVYEWMGSSEHPAFRQILALVKNYS